MTRLERQVNDEVLTRFPAGAVQRVALLQEGDEPQVGPEELLVRVFVGLAVMPHEAVAGDSDSSQAAAPSREESLQWWAAQHETAMRRLRRELSWRLPPARLLEFTIDDESDPGSAPRIVLPQNAGASIAAVMELVSGTYALIIDLRRNGGGSPDGVVFWCSYLFDGPGIHLNDIFEAETGETRQFWSMSYVPGSRYVDKPVYLLTSHETFSGGEDFCYTLQALGRAQLIGETTGGGAHPTGMRPLSPTMAISVPFARSVNPITGTNWEGTGVVPDVSVAAAEAYDVSYGMALRHVLSLDTPPPIHEEASATLARLSA